MQTFAKIWSIYLAHSAKVAKRAIYFTFRNFSDTNYLKIRWTDFHNLYIKWKPFGRRWSIWTSFFDISRDVAMATDFVQKLPSAPALIALSLRNGMGYRLADECINSSTNCSTSCKKMVKIGSVVFELNWGRKWKLCCESTEIGLYRGISPQLLNQCLRTFQNW